MRTRIDTDSRRIDRRQLFGRAAVLGVGATLPAALAACGDDDEDERPAGAGRTATAEGKPIVGDVLDFALSSDEWEGAFGFVSMRLHRGLVDGRDCWFIRTDTSDESYARRERLVFAPRLQSLASSDETTFTSSRGPRRASRRSSQPRLAPGPTRRRGASTPCAGARSRAASHPSPKLSAPRMPETPWSSAPMW